MALNRDGYGALPVDNLPAGITERYTAMRKRHNINNYCANIDTETYEASNWACYAIAGINIDGEYRMLCLMQHRTGTGYYHGYYSPRKTYYLVDEYDGIVAEVTGQAVHAAIRVDQSPAGPISHLAKKGKLPVKYGKPNGAWLAAQSILIA